MNKWTPVAAGVTLAVLPAIAHAQGGKFPDVPDSHWAYDAVNDLANAGLVLGYPDGKFLGNRTLTRYEMATIIKRVVDNLAQRIAQAPTGATTPPGVTQAQLDEVRKLVDDYKTELTVIGTDLKSVQAQLAQVQTDLQGKASQADLDAVRKDVNTAKDSAAKALDTANSAYGAGKRKFTISGYVQARFQNADSNDKTRFPAGSPATTSGAYNGNYAQNGTEHTFYLRRSRIKFAGQVTPNTGYGIQIDASGANGAAVSSTNQQVTLREAYVSYTFGDGSVMYPTVTAGMMSTWFGYELAASTATILTPERHLAFSESGNGLFANQDYERGVQLSYTRAPFTVKAGVVNGTGQASNDIDRAVDQIYRVAYQSPNKVIGAGLSYYYGWLPGTGLGQGTPATGTTPAVAPYSAGKRSLFGADAQYISPAGPFIMAEYVGGKYERRNSFGSPTALTTTALNPAFGNKVEGYYVQGGYTFGYSSPRPLTLGISYDVLRRSKSGLANSGSSFDDVNLGYGALYNLDKATRLRLWYTKPNKVSHLPSVAAPPKIGLWSSEVQVRF